MTDPVKIDVTTDDGVAPCWLHGADPAQPRPGVLFIPDAGSVRPAMQDMAARFASFGYAVLVPHLFYRSDPYAPFDVATVFSVPEERARLGVIMRALDAARAMSDVGHYLRALAEHPAVTGTRFGLVGYCIGGRIAFSAASAHPDRVAAAASIHGGGIATDADDSPHRNAAAIKGHVYLGIADDDQSCTPEQQGMVIAALASAHVRYTADMFTGARHGFAVPDFAVYDKAASDRHFERVQALFADTLH